jgi:hypothetical protein
MTVVNLNNATVEAVEQPVVEPPPVEQPPIEQPPVEQPPKQQPPEDNTDKLIAELKALFQRWIS